MTAAYSYIRNMIQTTARKRRGRPRRASARKKTVLLDQTLLDQARRALGLRTETETITRALQVIVARQRQIQGLRAFVALGPIRADLID